MDKIIDCPFYTIFSERINLVLFIINLKFKNMFKKILTLSIAIFCSFLLNAQEKSLKNCLTSKIWKLDVNEMKANLLIKLGTIPEMAKLSPEEKEMTIKSVLLTFEKMEYEFNIDGNHTIKTGKYTTKSTYTINDNQTEIELKSENADQNKYLVISYDESKIVLMDNRTNNKLILIPFN